MKRKRRDIYGNWVWTDDDEEQGMSKPNSSDSRLSKTEGPAAGGGERTNNSGGFERKEEERLGLEWRDYVALAIASLETILLPLVIFIAVIVMILLAIAYFR